MKGFTFLAKIVHVPEKKTTRVEHFSICKEGEKDDCACAIFQNTTQTFRQTLGASQTNFHKEFFICGALNLVSKKK